MFLCFLIRFLNILPKPTVTRNQKAALSDVVVHERWARFLKRILRIMFDHSPLVKCPPGFFWAPPERKSWLHHCRSHVNSCLNAPQSCLTSHVKLTELIGNFRFATATKSSATTKFFFRYLATRNVFFPFYLHSTSLQPWLSQIMLGCN